MEADSVHKSDLGASEILSRMMQLNRHSYRARIADAAEQLAEQMQPTSYIGFDSATGRAQLQSIDGNIIYGKSQTNGAVSKGDSIRLRGDFYDSMPRHKSKNPLINVSTNTSPTGLVIFRDCDWLDISTENNQKTFDKIITYFLKNNTIYTIGADSRIFINTDSEPSRIFGVLGFDEHKIPVNISKTLEQRNIKVKVIDLNQPNAHTKVKGCFVLPLFDQFNYEFTNIEKENLQKIAQTQGLIIFSEWIFWDYYTHYLLQVFNLLERIQVGGSYISVNWTKGEINKFNFPSGLITTNATGTFNNVSNNEKLLIINESAGLYFGILIGDDAEYIPTGESRSIPAKTPTAIYIQSKNLRL